MPKTTAEDFEKFKIECKKIIDRLGIYDWWVYYEWEKLEDAQAEYDLNLNSRQVTFRLNKGNIDAPIDILAKHEVVEALLLGKLKEMAKHRGYTINDIEEEVHRIVRILENRL